MQIGGLIHCLNKPGGSDYADTFELRFGSVHMSGHFRMKVQKCSEPRPRAGNSSSKWAVQITPPFKLGVPRWTSLKRSMVGKGSMCYGRESHVNFEIGTSLWTDWQTRLKTITTTYADDKNIKQVRLLCGRFPFRIWYPTFAETRMWGTDTDCHTGHRKVSRF